MSDSDKKNSNMSMTVGVTVVAAAVVAGLIAIALNNEVEHKEDNNNNNDTRHHRCQPGNNGIPGQIDQLQSQLSSAVTQVAGLQSQYNALQGTIASLSQDLSSGVQPIGPNASSNIISNVLNPLYQAGSGHKGLFALYGNAKTGGEGFAQVGEAAPSQNWTADTIVPFASVGKLITGTVFAKMCEEGLIQPQDTVFTYVPEFSGAVNYYTGMTIGTANDPSTWTPTYGSVNLNTITCNNLVSMNFPIGYGGLFHLGALGAGFAWNPANFAAQSGQGLLAQASAHQFYTMRQILFANSTTPGDIFMDKYKGLALTSATPVKDWLGYILNLAKTNQTALMFRPSTASDAVLPHKLTSNPAQYTLGMHYLGWVLDNCLRSKGYPGGFAQYLREKFLTPMNIQTMHVIGQEVPAAGAHAAIAFRRAANIASTATATTASFGVSPEYIADGKVGQLVWGSQYPNDGIVKLESGIDLSPYTPNDCCNGGTPVSSSPRDFAKFIKLILNNGLYGSTRLLSAQSVNWMTSPSISAGVNMYFAYPLASVDATGTSFCPGGFNRYNRDLVAGNNYAWSSSFCTMSGSSGMMIAFDLATKTYVIFGTLEPIWGSVAPAYRDDATAARLLTQATRTN
jgi:CubicO group peptidase (beta-lactamase class C family)